MSTYLIQFGVYTMAMVGAIFLCLIVFKKTMISSRCAKNNNELTIENALNLSQRKTLYVVNAGNERFLIAADAERTTFLSKLNNNEVSDKEEPIEKKFPIHESEIKSNSKEEKSIDYSDVISSLKNKKGPVLKEMMKKLNTPYDYGKEAV